jgi:hypothetical protein
MDLAVWPDELSDSAFIENLEENIRAGSDGGFTIV